jgi:hypothetical protein
MWGALAAIPAKVWLFILKMASAVVIAAKIKQSGFNEAEAKQAKSVLEKVGHANAIRQKVRNDASSGKRDKRLHKFDR